MPTQKEEPVTRTSIDKCEELENIPTGRKAPTTDPLHQEKKPLPPGLVIGREYRWPPTWKTKDIDSSLGYIPYEVNQAYHDMIESKMTYLGIWIKRMREKSIWAHIEYEYKSNAVDKLVNHTILHGLDNTLVRETCTSPDMRTMFIKRHTSTLKHHVSMIPF